MRASPLSQLLRGHNLSVLDDLAESSANVRQVESKVRGLGHVLVSVDPAGIAGAYRVTITTPAGTAQLSFDPDTPAQRLLHSVGVTKIPAKGPVSRYIPLDVAVELARLAERPA